MKNRVLVSVVVALAFAGSAFAGISGGGTTTKGISGGGTKGISGGGSDTKGISGGGTKGISGGGTKGISGGGTKENSPQSIPTSAGFEPAHFFPMNLARVGASQFIPQSSSQNLSNV
jgi:hypothetical protein